MPADELVETLGVARSHVSNSLKELQNWGVIKIVRLEGDRRDHFESIKDTWQLFEVLLEERKRREVDPTLQLLRETAAQMSQSPEPSPVRQRISEMLAFYEEVDRFYGEVKRLPLSARVGLLRAGGKIGSWLR
jgi:DNA-binding transcriptional regulator GbsR (MarR family)